MMISRDAKPALQDYKFSITIHLTDGTLTDVTDHLVLGTSCLFENGEIGCKLKETYYWKETNSTDFRQSTVFLVKNTGEIRGLENTLTFDGRSTTGTPHIRIQVKRIGRCRKGSPIF